MVDPSGARPALESLLCFKVTMTSPRLAFVLFYLVAFTSAERSVCDRHDRDGCPPPASNRYFAAADGPMPSSNFVGEFLPGATRSVLRNGYAIVAPESRVYASLPGWSGVSAANLISPAMGAAFSMYIAESGGSVSANGRVESSGVERLMFVLKGTLEVVGDISGQTKTLSEGGYLYNPPDTDITIRAFPETSFLVFDRIYESVADEPEPKVIISSEEEIDVEVVPGEMFALRRLLPVSASYDFNIHIMDFEPGEYLNVKEVM